MPPPSYFPLRWESTGDQWWYASPIDWAAANGHYDLVRQLLRLDGNHLIKLTSLRRIRRLETVWDDEEQFHDVAKWRSEVARKLLSECEIKKGKNSLIGAGYGGWLLYTAASAGDLVFVQELLQRARFWCSERANMAFSSAAEEQAGEIPTAYKSEIMNRALHAAARGGNLKLMQEFLCNCSDDPLAYRDIHGATILHAAAARGQVEVVMNLTSSYPDITNSTDNHGDTALHMAAHAGHLAVVEALILASPSLVEARNNAGETFLHSVVAGFQTPGFRRLDRQIELMKHLLSGKIFKIEQIINAITNDGSTALHLAIAGNIDSDLVQVLMNVSCIDVNIRDTNGMTPLDILRQRPCSPSSELITRQLVSVGGTLSTQDYSARKAMASHIKRQSIGNSPGTSFTISDTEIFLHTGMDSASDGGSRSIERSTYSSEASQQSSKAVSHTAEKVKCFLYWPKMKRKKTSDRLKELVDASASVGVPTPLRQRFSTPSSLPNNKRALPVKSNVLSPTAKKKLASGMVNGEMQAVPCRSRSSSFSKLSSSSQSSIDQAKGRIGNDISKPPGCNQENDSANTIHKHVRSMNQYLCFGGARRSFSGVPQTPFHVYETTALSAC
ncbi:inversin-like [Dorcoceras hygrometricum]|uniref:Inversin-like n=1 Tax=Dorcoceras hygrometricum TaxID=472368 RepID=A0A2Z7A8Z5_9LAMI|nr:inversin-like [Dorcoceras hygrometricum]